MLYLSDRDLRAIGTDWPALVRTVEGAVRLIDSGDFAQPVKPYLRYKDPQNRIIAMPAYVGGEVNAAGIKWIASFPENPLRFGLPRAHSVIVLNDPETGRPAAILNSPLPSIARTAALSGLMMRHYFEARPMERRVQVGILGWGPLGRAHLDMAVALYGDRIERIRVFDPKGTDLEGVPFPFRSRTESAESWEDVYRPSDIVITCTVADRRYIDLPPAPGRLLLNISLRDYLPEALASVRAVIVDDWEEVCRENTDIEQLHLKRGLSRADTRTIADVVCRGASAGWTADQPVLFCPMGMAVFDIAAAVYYVEKAKESGRGALLE